MVESNSPPIDTSDRGRTRSRLAVIAAVAAVVVLVAVCAIVALRWRADRAYVGTSTEAQVSWGDCLNGVLWQDPSNGASWWAGHDLAVTGDYESEPVRVRMAHYDDPAAPPTRYVMHSSVGTIHFDAYDRATFTSRVGGTMLLTRPLPGASFTADCVAGGGNGAHQPPPKSMPWAEIAGVLGHPAPAPDGTDLVLAKGVIHIEVNGADVQAVPVDGRAPYFVNLPVGTVTLRGTDDGGDCGTVTLTVVSGDHVTGDLVCDRP
jgi:hypothetical protein